VPFDALLQGYYSAFTERGTPDHAVRASFAVLEERGYVVGDIKVDGLPITRGAHVADKVRIRIGAIVKPGDHQPARRRCVE
jgi:sensor histidine kinase regulating citrate/malate metabolism